MKFAAITTFNREGLELYGRKMVSSFRKYTPREVRFRVYTEGWSLGAGFEERDLLTSSPWLDAFRTRHAGRTVPDLRWDAVRFSHKVAALCHAARDIEADCLIWIDGDVVLHAPILLDDLADLAPKGDEWIAWLDRDRNYPECGFYMLNTRHGRHRETIASFESMYLNDRLFDLEQFHDSWVLWKLVEALGLEAKSLSGEGRATAHPFVNGPLGAWFDHLKGPRKSEGRSRQSDLKRARAEAYWS